MDKTTIIGIILGIIAIGAGMILKGLPAAQLLNPAAILIILGGTIAAVTIAFPTSEIKRIPKLFGIIFREPKMPSIEELIPMFSDWANTARKEGLLALEAKIYDIEDPFLKNGLSMAVDGQSIDFIRDVMIEEIEAMEERHQAGAQIFSQAGTYAPTLGVLGAVVGLIAALSNMTDTEALGHAISAAFVATLMGIFTGYVLWHPFANKLKQKSKYEMKIRHAMIEGILSIVEGQNPRKIEQKLMIYLSKKEREKLETAGEYQDA